MPAYWNCNTHSTPDWKRRTITCKGNSKRLSFKTTTCSVSRTIAKTLSSSFLITICSRQYAQCGRTWANAQEMNFGKPTRSSTISSLRKQNLKSAARTRKESKWCNFQDGTKTSPFRRWSSRTSTHVSMWMSPLELIIYSNHRGAFIPRLVRILHLI